MRNRPKIGALVLLLSAALLPLGAALRALPTAYAESHLSTLGGGNVNELAHKLAIDYAPETATVDETIVLANPGASSVEAVYLFDLPAQAAISGLKVTNPGGASGVYGVVDAEAATRLVAAPAEEAKPDRAILRMISSQGDGTADRKRYELRVYPVPGGASTEVEIHWQSPVQMVAGNYHLRIPDRGSQSQLARTEVVVSSATKFRRFYGGGTIRPARAGKRNRYRFFSTPGSDLVLQATTAKANSKPRAELALVPLSATTGFAAIRVLVPKTERKPTPKLERILILVDVSRSLDAAGRNAAVALADGLLLSSGNAVRVEAILFDRRARRLLGSWQSNQRSVRATLTRGIRDASSDNGSDLSTALSLARGVIAEGQPQGDKATLVALISDGVLPSTTSTRDVFDSLGPKTLRETRFLASILVPPNAPLPDLRNSVLSSLAHRMGGRIVPVRIGEAKTRAPQLLQELTREGPMENLSVELSQGDWVAASLPGIVTPGSSLAGLGYYQGGRPKNVIVRGSRGGIVQTLKTIRVPAKQAAALKRVILATSHADSFPGGEDAKGSRAAFLRASAALGVVTRVGSAIVIAGKDGFARDRLKIAERWGASYYRRLPPPAERGDEGPRFRPFKTLPRARPGIRRETGALDTSMIQRRIRAQVLPKAQGCYEHLLRKNANAAGTVKLHLEVARGEVHHARIRHSAASLRPIASCIVDALYAMRMPRVRLGNDPEVVHLALYPLRFRLRQKERGSGHTNPHDRPSRTDVRGNVTVDPQIDIGPIAPIDTSDPLSGLPD